MTRLFRMLLISLAALAATAGFAQSGERRAFSQAEIDQVLAPIALYPDQLLSQILMASTYPQDVFEAAAEARRAPDVRGEEAVRRVENAPWDASVIALAGFPDVLMMMDERRDWTERLGDMYIAQPEQVMETVQALRARADANGALQGGEQMTVERNGADYVIESPPEVVYVPYYDPRVVYGSWWWPDYQPVWWNPWPGYSYRWGYAGFGWGYGVRWRPTYWLAGIDWHHRHVRYSQHRPWYSHGNHHRAGNRWTHNVEHRNRGGDRRWTGGRDGRDGRDGRRDQRPTWRGDERRSYQEREVQRDGRTWDRGGDRDRGDRGGRDRRSSVTPGGRVTPGAPATQAASTGFFAPQTGASLTASTPVSPVSRGERAQRNEQRAAQRAERMERVQRVVPPATNGVARQVEARGMSAPRAARVQGSAPAPAVPHVRTERASAPAAAPARAPQRSERAASAPARGHSENRGEGRGHRGDNGNGHGRGRDR